MLLLHTFEFEFFSLHLDEDDPLWLSHFLADKLILTFQGKGNGKERLSNSRWP